jgi:coenzyme F420-reducing hydrogenase gamma subunit
VRVDYELWGCPIDVQQLLSVLRALLADVAPRLPTHSVCLDCKRSGLTCVVVAQGTPCLGPVTRTGCGAICPGMQRGCYGCFGPSDDPNLDAFTRLLASQGLSRDDALRRLRGINGYAPAFRKAGDAIADKE